MVFSRFLWTLLAYVVAIAGTSVLFGIYLQKPTYPVTLILLLLALFAESLGLIWYLTRIRRDLLRLVSALRHDDISQQFSKARNDPYFSSIHEGFNELIRDFRLIRLDMELEHRFFKETVNHVPFGLLAFNAEGEVRMVNDPFLELLGVGEPASIRDLGDRYEELPGLLQGIEPGKEQLRKMEVPDGKRHLIFLASGFILNRESIRLVSVRDLSRELDRNELEAWQKLLRVMRHEILNSLSPIRLIAGNLGERLRPKDADGNMNGASSLPELDQEELGDIRTGLETIHRRAEGLSLFLEAYGSLNRSPELNLEESSAEALLHGVMELFRDEAERKGVRLEMSPAREDLMLRVDIRQIEQVLINLTRNALEAFAEQENKCITFGAWREKADTIISVKDNGCGIPGESRDDIFIPFYSSKEKGSGIGLSLSRQIMIQHGAAFQVLSEPGKGSEFRLVFRPDGPGFGSA